MCQPLKWDLVRDQVRAGVMGQKAETMAGGECPGRGNQEGARTELLYREILLELFLGVFFFSVYFIL